MDPDSLLAFSLLLPLRRLKEAFLQLRRIWNGNTCAKSETKT